VWTDVPTKAQVSEIVDKHQAGYFDGMNDYLAGRYQVSTVAA
jgi:hypothetical protein